MVRPVDQEVEPPWVEPKVDQTEQQVGQTEQQVGHEVVRPWVEPKVDQTEQQVGQEVVRPSEEPKVDQTEQQVGLMVRQVGWQQEMVGVQVAPLVGHQIPRVVGQMQVCLRARMEDLAERLEGPVVVHPSGGTKECQVEFDWQGWTTTANLSAMIQGLPSQAQKLPFQRHQRWFLVLLVVPHLIHPWPLEGAQVRR